MAKKRPVERWLFSCEHGGRSVPDEFAHLFQDAEAVLESHQGWDAGALEVFNALAPVLGDASFPATTTRLLIDLNRSLHHPRVFSEFTRPLPPGVREHIVAHWWRPWRQAVEGTIAGWRDSGSPVRHFSVHSFTPVLSGQVRNADIGLLYDPSRPAERDFCIHWQARLEERGWRVRRNYPYRGTADGHTTTLRPRFRQGYAGIELEINQALLPHLLGPVCTSLHDTLAEWGHC
jgi:predicted N-formylglutamate amidohydrolase